VAAARSAFEEAMVLHRSGDLTGAAAALRRSLAALSLNPLAHLWLGRVELERGEAKEAEGALRTAIAVGAVQQIKVEEAWPLLLDALTAQAVDAKKKNRVVDDYLREFPTGRFRERIEAARAQ
jgi:thioredoxin-like negative regulator of GroEL